MQCQAEVVNWLFGKHTFFLKYYRQMRENKIVANNGSSIVIYTTEDGNTQLEVKLEQDMVCSLKAKWQSYVVVNLINKDNQ